MGLFGPTKQERVKERSIFVKELASKFNAKYYYGINNIKNSFYIDNDRDMDDSNIIALSNITMLEEEKTTIQDGYQQFY